MFAPSRSRLTPLAALSASLVAAGLMAACGGGDEPATTDAAKLAAQPTLQAVTAPAATTAAVAWSNAPGGVDVALDATGNVYTAAWAPGPGGDIALTKRNAAGVVQWTRGFDNTDTSRFETAGGVVVDGAGNVIVSGTIRSVAGGPIDLNGVVMKFTPDGTLIWRATYGNALDGPSTRRVLADAAGNSYVMGWGLNSASRVVVTVRSFTPDGVARWVWYDPAGTTVALEFTWGGDGNLVIAGLAAAGVDGAFSLINPLTGMPPRWGNGKSDVAIDAQGNLFGMAANPGTTGGVVNHASAPFGGLWDVAVDMTPTGIEVDAAGNAIVSGVTAAGTAFMKFAPDGTVLWSNQDADGAGVAVSNHLRMRLDAAGNAYVVGSALGQTAVVKINADGTTGWTATFAGGDAASMALGSGGSVVTTVLNGVTTRVDEASTPPPPAADVSVTLTDAPDPVKLNNDVVFTATVRNVGPQGATAVALDALLPSGLALRTVSTTQGTCRGTTAVACSLGSIASNGQAVVTLRARARTVGTKVTQASVRAAEADPVSANNSASQTTTVVRR